MTREVTCLANKKKTKPSKIQKQKETRIWDRRRLAWPTRSCFEVIMATCTSRVILPTIRGLKCFPRKRLLCHHFYIYNVCVCVCVRAHVRVYACVYVCVYLCAYVCAHVRAYVYVRANVCACMCPRLRVLVCAQGYDTRTHTHTHKHTHTSTCQEKQTIKREKHTIRIKKTIDLPRRNVECVRKTNHKTN